MEDEVAPEVQGKIIEQKLTLLRNSIYDASLDAKIARVMEDMHGEKAALERMRKLLKAVEMLEAEVSAMKPDGNA